MSDLKIAIIVGSLRKESFNLKLAHAITRLGASKFQAAILRIDDLPLFNQDLEKEFPAAATRLKSEIQKADGILIVTPEYNRSIPAPLKNAIDWASRPYGTNSFAGKPVGVIGTSPGAVGTACAQHSLHPVLIYLDAHLMGQPEVYLQFKEGLIDDEGALTNEGTQKFLSGYVDRFAQHVVRFVVKS